MEEIFIENEVAEKARKTAVGICAVFAVGFLFGAAAVALFDYYDNKKEQLKKIKRDSDENYIYSE
ncbi:MAG: hypothetical protein K2I00_06785 [Ruminococcus sp.]|nr:hypothetical protein [Ruminococcus sp.]